MKRCDRCAVLVLLLASLGGGCASVVEYTPKSGLLSTLGAEAASRELRQTTMRALEPKFTMVEIFDDRLRVVTTIASYGVFYQHVQTPVIVDIYFANVARIEIYDNNEVIMYHPGDVPTFGILFVSQDDAKRFADLLDSFRAAQITPSPE